MKTSAFCLGLATMLTFNATAGADITFRKIVLGANQTGEPAPGGGGNFSTELQAPVINRTGAVVFQASVAGANGEFGIWTADKNGKVKLIAIEGGKAAGTTGNFTDLRFSPVIDELGAVAFYGETDVPPDRQGVWATEPGGAKLQLIAFPEKPLGDQGYTPSGIEDTPRLVNGRISFAASFAYFFGTYYIYIPSGLSSEPRSAIFAGPLKVQKLAFWEDTPVDLPDNTVDHDNTFLGSLLNSAGEVATGFTGKGGNGTFVPFGIAIVSPQGPVEAIDCREQTVQGAGNVVNLDPNVRGFNEESEVLLHGSVGLATDLDQIPGVFAGPLRDLRTVVLAGTAAPGLAATSYFGNIFYPTFASQTRVAFYGDAITPPATQGGPTETVKGIWTDGTDRLPEAVAIGGTDAPGMPAGVKFSKFTLLQAQEGLFVNRQGVVAFIAGMEGIAGYDPFSRKGRALYAGLPGALQVIAHGGDPFEVAPGDIRTIDRISVVNVGISFGLANPSGGGRSALNDANEIAFKLTFLGGTAGIFVAKLDLAAPANTPPFARTDAVGIRAASTKIDVLGNDTDVNGDPLTVTGITPAGFGTAKLAGKTITYQPGAQFTGSDTFTYTVADGRGGSDIGTVTIAGPFGKLQGNYTQLVTAGPNAANQIPVGIIAAKLSPGGVVSGKVTLRGETYTLKGVAGFDGSFDQVIERKNADDLLIHLEFALDNAGVALLTAHIGGDEPHYYNVDAKPVGVTELPTGLVAGAYTVLLAPDATAAHPRGIGWATGKLTETGELTLTGRLGDDTPFSVATAIDATGAAPFFIPIYVKPKGDLFGTLVFQSQAQSHFTGTLTWRKPKQDKPGGLFEPGFIATTAATGHRYVLTDDAPSLSYTAPATARADVHFRGGGAPNIDAAVSVTIADKVSADLATANAVKVTIKRASGLLGGSFIPVAGEKAIKFTGVLHQGENRGAGFFPGTNQTGTVTMIPQ